METDTIKRNLDYYVPDNEQLSLKDSINTAPPVHVEQSPASTVPPVCIEESSVNASASNPAAASSNVDVFPDSRPKRNARPPCC